MAKANRSMFKDLVLKTTYVYEYKDENGNDKTFDFTIRQLTVNDIADITSEDNGDGDYLLIARSLDMTLDDIYELPITAVKGLVEKIVEFNQLDDIINE